MNPKITDAGVAGLPLHEGRAELLEEIMATDTNEIAERSAERPTGRRTGWVPVAAAAAVVAAMGLGLALPRLLDDPTTVEEPLGVAAGGPHGPDGLGEIAVLEAKGWKVTHAQAGEHGGELSYEAEDPSLDATPSNERGVALDIHWRAGDSYESYVVDREGIGPSEAVEVLGKPAKLWSYSRDDHTTIREVVGDFTLEVRGTGLGKSDYLALLDQLTGIAAADLDAHVPDVQADPVPVVPAPPKPMLLRADGWTPALDEELGQVVWSGPDGARLHVVWVEGVRNVFRYDRYRQMPVREEIQLLGERTLLTEWEEGGTQYRVAATSPVVDETILVLEGTGLTRQEFLDVVRSAEWVSEEEHKQAVSTAAPADTD